MAEINIAGFTGMNNLVPAFYGGKNLASPKILLNADVDMANEANVRDGYAPYISLSGSHSLWSCESCMLCAANKRLYDLSNGTAIQKATISGPEENLDYELCEGKVYISNKYWSTIYDPITKTTASWGIALPPAPMLVFSSGNLPAGLYHVCFTNVSGNEISGNGPITSIELNSAGGIRVLNRPSGAIVWATEKYGYVFSKVGTVDTIIDIPMIEPLPTFFCAPPPNMQNLSYAHGRLWGSVGPELYYSEAYRPDLFKINANRFKFESDITLIAKVSTGLFIGLAQRTVFLSGTDPEQMQQSNAGAGSVRGTLAYCNNLPELGDILGTPEKGYVDVPVWRTTEGIVAGNASGRLFNLSKHKVVMGSPQRGASLYRQKNGEFQFLTSADLGVSGSGRGGIDVILKEAFRLGKLTETNVVQDVPTTSARMTEDVSCEVRRGGVLI